MFRLSVHNAVTAPLNAKGFALSGNSISESNYVDMPYKLSAAVI